MQDDKVRKHFGDYLGMAEVAILTILAILISLTALGTIARSGQLLWDTWHQWMVVTDTDVVLRVLDQLLVVLMLVEILHTVRISIRSHTLVTEPFLVVGLIASIMRILVITLEAASLTKPDISNNVGPVKSFLERTTPFTPKSDLRCSF